MKHCVYVYGASDDLVIVESVPGGVGKRRVEEFIAISGTYETDVDGTTIRFQYASTWTAEVLTVNCAHEFSIISSVDLEDEGIKHTHDDVPQGCPGYSDCLILSSDRPFDTITGWDE